jgi:hypothetical protein
LALKIRTTTYLAFSRDGRRVLTANGTGSGGVRVEEDAKPWGGLRWASLPPVPKPHCSGKVAVVGHTRQRSGEVLDPGYPKCIDTFCHGGGG